MWCCANVAHARKREACCQCHTDRGVNIGQDLLECTGGVRNKFRPMEEGRTVLLRIIQSYEADPRGTEDEIQRLRSSDLESFCFFFCFFLNQRMSNPKHVDNTAALSLQFCQHSNLISVNKS